MCLFYSWVHTYIYIYIYIYLFIYLFHPRYLHNDIFRYLKFPLFNFLRLLLLPSVFRATFLRCTLLNRVRAAAAKISARGVGSPTTNFTLWVTLPLVLTTVVKISSVE